MNIGTEGGGDDVTVIDYPSRFHAMVDLTPAPVRLLRTEVVLMARDDLYLTKPSHAPSCARTTSEPSINSKLAV
jgi:hypothetical protein